METLAAIKFSEKDQKILETPEKLYDYLKKKYGVENSEKVEGTVKRDAVTNIFAQAEVSFPGFSKVSENHHWTIHLEKNEPKGNIPSGSVSLIIGEHWSSRNVAWSRFIQIESKIHHNIGSNDDGYHARCRYDVIENNLFERDFYIEFKKILMLMEIVNEFLEQY